MNFISCRNREIPHKENNKIIFISLQSRKSMYIFTFAFCTICVWATLSIRSIIVCTVQTIFTVKSIGKKRNYFVIELLLLSFGLCLTIQWFDSLDFDSGNEIENNNDHPSLLSNKLKDNNNYHRRPCAACRLFNFNLNMFIWSF